MKRLFMVMVAMLSMTLTYAENETASNLNTTEAYDLKTVNMKKLGQALNLSKDQVESFAEAAGEERTKMVDKAISKDLAYMNYILSADQYRKYVMLLNMTLINRGLK